MLSDELLSAGTMLCRHVCMLVLTQNHLVATITTQSGFLAITAIKVSSEMSVWYNEAVIMTCNNGTIQFNTSYRYNSIVLRGECFEDVEMLLSLMLQHKKLCVVTSSDTLASY